jgi:hypothetical protein
MTPKSPPRRYSQRPILNSRLTTQFAHTFTTTQTCNPNLISLPFQRLYSILPWTVQVLKKTLLPPHVYTPSQLFPQFNLKNSYKHPCKEFLQTPVHLLRSQVHIKLNSLSLSLSLSLSVQCLANATAEKKRTMTEEVCTIYTQSCWLVNPQPPTCAFYPDFLLLTIWKKQGIKALPVPKLGMEEPPPRSLHNLMQGSSCFKEHLKN